MSKSINEYYRDVLGRWGDLDRMATVNTISDAHDPNDFEEGDTGRNIVIQLRKVITLRGAKNVVFENGDSQPVSTIAATKALGLLDNTLKPLARLELQKRLSASPESFANAVAA
jgi:hypothetical protein